VVFVGDGRASGDHFAAALPGALSRFLERKAAKLWLLQTLLYLAELVDFIMRASGRAASVGDFLPSLLPQRFVVLAITWADVVHVLCHFSEVAGQKLAVSDQSEQLPAGISPVPLSMRMHLPLQSCVLLSTCQDFFHLFVFCLVSAASSARVCQFGSVLRMSLF